MDTNVHSAAPSPPGLCRHDGMHCDEHQRQKGDSEADKHFEAYRKENCTRDCPR